MSKAFRQVEIVRVRGGQWAPDGDRAATEEPLAVRLHDRPFAVIMRTPGADRELAAGFLLAERVIRNADELGTIEHCRDETPAARRESGADDAAGAEHAPGPAGAAANIVNVTLAGRSAAELDRLLAERRETLMSSSCGLCGRLTIESLAHQAAPLPAGSRVSAAVVSALPLALRAAQAVFDETGGLHAAGLFGLDGGLAAMAEDVGRHNAVDKVVGRMLMADALPLSASILFVSGRTSFEIVQKALFAGIPIVASVSAPSSLAIDLARETNITLAGFVRGGAFNIYSHEERVT